MRLLTATRWSVTKFVAYAALALIAFGIPESFAQQDQALCADVIKKTGTVSRISHTLQLFLWWDKVSQIELNSSRDFPSQARVHMEKHAWQEGTLSGVASIKNTVSYAGLDSIIAYQSKEEEESGCHVKMAKMTNKYGTVVSATSDSAQAAVRANSAVLRSSPDCPGFGLCAEIMDSGDSDVWPVTTLTVSPCLVRMADQEQRQIQLCH